ncbi:F0F1 ATP synthase subunit delta [Natribacillus halophilus]|uniref:ATP synthase subunit delta n=1 Tax=Natribacillus halophilus TaxID=549003 RepID=A0A1G8KU52_9BACI|nr:F0F1 ATP synthase subunit delta [Natribacillus halophilus]SDI46951.1 ATP synthase F1 subcomplex delta subunit [Natribacillus halophilus]
MSAPAVANRYAKALFELAKEKGIVEQINDEIQGVQAVFESVPQLQEVMAHPRMSVKDQRTLLQTGFSDCHAIILNTLYVMVDRGRIDIIAPVAHAFQSFADEEFQIARANVRAVRPLSDREKEEVARQFAKKVNNRQVVVTSEEDDDLIGGLIVQIGDSVYDGSVRGMLRRMERKLVTTNR